MLKFMKKVENMLKNLKINYGYRYPLLDEWLLRKTDCLKNGLGLTDRPDFGMVVVDAPIKLPRKFQVDPKTQTHFLSDLFFLIAIRPVVGIYNHNVNFHSILDLH